MHNHLTNRDRTLRWFRPAVCKTLLTYLDDLGIPIDRLLDKHRLQVLEREDADYLVPRHSFGLFMMEVIRREGLEKLGWQFAAEHPGLRATLGGGPTLYSALRTAVKRARASTGLDFRLVEAPDSVGFCRTLSGNIQDYDHEMGWSAMGAAVRIVRDYLGKEWVPAEVSVSPEAAGARWVSEVLPDARITTTHEYWCLRISHFDLGRGLSVTNGAGHASRAQDTGKPVSELGLAEALGQFLRAHIRGGAPSLEESAEMVGVSARTLKRRLNDVTRTYSGTLLETRLSLSLEILETTDLAVADVAHEVGYSNPSNFSRAFRRVVGITPQAYRFQTRVSERGPR